MSAIVIFHDDELDAIERRIDEVAVAAKRLMGHAGF